MKKLKEKLLKNKINQVVTETHYFIYQLPFIQNNNEYHITFHIDGKTIYADVFVRCANKHQQAEALERWRKYDRKLNFSLFYDMHVYLNIVEEHVNIEDVIRHRENNHYFKKDKGESTTDV